MSCVNSLSLFTIIPISLGKYCLFYELFGAKLLINYFINVVQYFTSVSCPVPVCLTNIEIIYCFKLLEFKKTYTKLSVILFI